MTIVIIGGVTAVGKTSVARRLSEIYGWDYVEADAFHSAENIEKMKVGMPLTDDDRLPWLQTLHQKLDEYASRNENCIMTCSALKRVYRNILFTGSPDNTVQSQIQASNQNCYFIFLTAPKDLLHQRLIQRQNQHFMNPKLLESQLQISEVPDSETTDELNTYVINCESLTLDEIVDRIKQIIQ